MKDKPNRGHNTCHSMCRSCEDLCQPVVTSSHNCSLLKCPNQKQATPYCFFLVRNSPLPSLLILPSAFGGMEEYIKRSICVIVQSLSGNTSRHNARIATIPGLQLSGLQISPEEKLPRRQASSIMLP